MPMTDHEINARICEALRIADAPQELCEDPLRMRGRAFRFARRPKDETDEQRPLIGSVIGYEYDPRGILKIHVDVRTFRDLSFTTIDFDVADRSWMMKFASNMPVHGRLTFL